MGKKASSSSSQNKFRFKKHDNIGVSDAEQDQNFLYSCFVDTGDLDWVYVVDDALLPAIFGPPPEALVRDADGRGRLFLFSHFGLAIRHGNDLRCGDIAPCLREVQRK